MRLNVGVEDNTLDATTPAVRIPSVMLDGKDGHRSLLNQKDNAAREIRHPCRPNTRLKWPEPIWFLKNLGDRGLNAIHKPRGGAACLRVGLYRIEKLGPSALMEAPPHLAVKRQASANTSSASSVGSPARLASKRSRATAAQRRSRSASRPLS